MFLLQADSNRISSITSKKFSDLNFTERNHLQEWIANSPDSLGEDLLIIQKEYDGFDGTQERLDLLALDKDGNLVIIENKLDDSGRDVVWQALKYASYCSTLKPSEIIRIFQEYLNKNRNSNEEKDASSELLEFYNASDVDEINLNNSQRIIFVAANFRKEVTSTAVWLINQGISIKCIKVTPYCLNNEILINFEQIVPTPETEDLIISGIAKQSEVKQMAETQKVRYALREEYWKLALEEFRNSSCRLFDNISPSKDHWESAGSGISSCTYQLIFGKEFIRVILNLDKADKDANKLIFDKLYEQKDKIEQDFSAKLEWVRLDDKKSSRIQFAKAVDGYNQENWKDYAKWQIEHMIKLENATKEKLLAASKALKNNA